MPITGIVVSRGTVMASVGARGTLRQIWKAIKQLNPNRPVNEADQPFTLALVVCGDVEATAMREFLLNWSTSPQDIALADKVIQTYVSPLDGGKRHAIRKADFLLVDDELASEVEHLTDKLFYFNYRHPERSLVSIINSRRGTELRLSLAMHLPAFRLPVARRIVREISRENAMFVIATALGNVVPSVFEPILGIAEAASDTVILTANQVRMLFMLGAIYGAKVGYMAQWKELSSIVGTAFGWRSLARNLVSKIPFGGGLVPKGAVAYAGTTVVGQGMVFFYTTGRKMTKQEVKEAFSRAYSEAVGNVRSLVSRLRSRPSVVEGSEDSG